MDKVDNIRDITLESLENSDFMKTYIEGIHQGLQAMVEEGYGEGFALNEEFEDLFLETITEEMIKPMKGFLLLTSLTFDEIDSYIAKMKNVLIDELEKFKSEK